MTVEGAVIPTPLTTKQESKSAPAEENIGFFSGLAIGAVAGGPIGAVAGGITGALLGEHYHKQKVANHELAADLSGSNAEKAKLTQTVMQLDGSLDHARELTVNISFKTGDADLTPDDIDQLTTLGQLAGSMPGVKIQVSGSRGSARRQGLQRRAIQGSRRVGGGSAYERGLERGAHRDQGAGCGRRQRERQPGRVCVPASGQREAARRAAEPRPPWRRPNEGSDLTAVRRVNVARH